jgi:hypothetical protein
MADIDVPVPSTHRVLLNLQNGARPLIRVQTYVDKARPRTQIRVVAHILFNSSFAIEMPTVRLLSA